MKTDQPKPRKKDAATPTGAVFTEPERCPRCKGVGFIGKAVDIKGEPIPKPTGEWTAAQVQGTFAAHGWEGICRSHDAELAKARLEAHNYWSQAVDSAQQQLASEREKLKAIIQTHAEAYGKACAALTAERKRFACLDAVTHTKIQKQLAAAQAAERDCSKRFEVQVADCHQQLAAEREKREQEKQVSLSWTKSMSKKHQQLREQLAAEREKRQEAQVGK